MKDLYFCHGFRFPGCEEEFFNFSWKNELRQGFLDWMTAKSWSLGDSGWPFDSLYGRKSVFKPEGSWMEWSIKWGEHCLKPVLCFLLGYNHDPNCVASDKFRYGCSYKTKRWKCISFMSFPTEIKSIHCNAVWIWHPRCIFAYLFVANRSTYRLNWNLSQNF